jgi:cyclopropane-fatty-acyl-phospholipid synthase
MPVSTKPSIYARSAGAGGNKIGKPGTRLKWPRLEWKSQVEKILSRADITIDGSRDWDISVSDDRFYRRVLLHGSLGLGESYMNGWWDCPSLDQFFSRVLCAKLDRNPFWNWRFVMARLIADGFNQQTRSRAKRVAKQHYDLGNDLYQNMLDHRMVYTCARWEHAASLDEAQEQKLDFVCRKLGLEPGMKLLDIGCGWGSLAKFAAQKYGVKVVGITLSREQVQLAREMCEGLPIEIRLQDYRDIHGTFDRVASLGMFEHVGYKNYKRFLETAHHCLRPGGFFYLSTIGSNYSIHATDPWFDKYIFPNSYLPSAALISTAMEGLFIVEGWENWRQDYDRTVMAWFQNFQQHWEDLEPRYGVRFYRMWKYYLMAAAATFRARRNQVWQIVAALQ